MLVFNHLILLKELNMPACATQKTIADAAPISNLFLPVPDTDFRDFLDEVAQLLRFAPEIIAAIDSRSRKCMAFWNAAQDGVKTVAAARIRSAAGPVKKRGSDGRRLARP